MLTTGMKRIQRKNGVSTLLEFLSLLRFFHPPDQLAVNTSPELINPNAGLSPKTPRGKTPPPQPSHLLTTPSPPNSISKSNPSAVSNQTTSSSKESKSSNRNLPSSSTTSTDLISALASATVAPKTASDSVPVASAVLTLVKPVKTLLEEMASQPLFWVAGKAVGVFGEAAPRLMGLHPMDRTDGLSDAISTLITIPYHV